MTVDGSIPEGIRPIRSIGYMGLKFLLIFLQRGYDKEISRLMDKINLSQFLPNLKMAVINRALGMIGLFFQDIGTQ